MKYTHTKEHLRELQALPLYLKVKITKQRIREWVGCFGLDGVYVSFSGGKDSTVLLHIVREEYPDVPAVFFDTGLEWPEVREFVKNFENVVLLKPKKNFRQVIEEYGYPFISKEVAQQVYEVQTYGKEKAKWAYAKFCPDSDYNKRYQGRFSTEKYTFLLQDDAPRLSHKCCNVMKKSIGKEYVKQTGRHPIIGTMTEESALRETQWLKNGCNSFEGKDPSCKPMSFWTEQDVYKYILENELKIAKIYGDVVVDYKRMGCIEGQMQIQDFIDIDTDNCLYKTTGAYRTGCMFCGFGCHLEKHGEGRFTRLKVTHPKIYDYIMRPWEEGGLNYKEVIDWLNQHGNLHIRY